ncbi:MAG: FG-GAP repeat protein [Candidatus Liptonbacteria bacterium]
MDRVSNQSLPSSLEPIVNRTLGKDDSSYHIKENLTAQNQNNNYTARFTKEGVQISKGFNISVPNVSYANPRIDKNTVTYDRGTYTEWYINTPRGIEQGFTINRPADIKVAFSNPISIDKDGKGASIANTALRYQGLYAIDANGKDLPVYLEKTGNNTLAIRTDDTNAKYPITVDPYVEQQKLVASDGAANDIFGSSVAISSDGTRVVMGSPRVNSNRGAVYVYTLSGGVWGDEKKIVASDAAVHDFLGTAVAISSDGTRIVTGAYGVDVGATSSQGAAYVYTLSGGTWGSEQKITASDGAANANLGSSVAISSDGTRVILGELNVISSGAAYVYTLSGGEWGNEKKIKAREGEAINHLGK